MVKKAITDTDSPTPRELKAWFRNTMSEVDPMMKDAIKECSENAAAASVGIDSMMNELDKELHKFTSKVGKLAGMYDSTLKR